MHTLNEYLASYAIYLEQYAIAKARQSLPELARAICQSWGKGPKCPQNVYLDFI